MKVEIKLTLVIDIDENELEAFESNRDELFDRVEEDLFATLDTNSYFQGSDDVDYNFKYKSIGAYRG